MKHRLWHLALVPLLACARPAAAQCEVSKIHQIPGQQGARFGWAVALDGGRAAVGQLGSATAAPNEVTLYEWNGQVWSQTAEIPSPGPLGNDGFGEAVALDGSLLAVAAPGDDQAGTNFGAVYVFEHDGTAWNQAAKLLPASPAAGSFGASVAITGPTVLVGAPTEWVPAWGENDGSVYAFEKAGASWVEVQRLHGTDQDPALGSDRFGEALATDGSRLAVGSPEVSAAIDSWKGTVYVFDRSGGLWIETAQVAPALPMSDGASFGASLDISASRLVVGAPFDLFGPGTVLFYDQGPQGWVESARFGSFPFDLCFNCTGSFGLSVALDGDHALIGDPSLGPGSTGAAHVLAREGGGWTHTGRIFASDGDAGDQFGFALALDSGRAVAGAPWDDVPGQGALEGSAYLYDLASPPASYCTGKTNSLGCLASLSWHGVPSLTNPLPFDVVAGSLLNNKPGLLFYGTNGRASLPFLGGTLCVQPPLQRTAPQTSGGDPPPLDSCTGSLTFDFNALLQSGADPALVPGVVVDAQFWSRDADQLDGTGVHLTHAVELAVCP